MSRRSGEHAKTTAGYEARHAKPGAPGPAALLGTAAKAVPVTLAAGAAGSALVLSGTASATVPAGLAGGSLVSSGAADVAAMKTAHIMLTRAHHAGHHAGHRSAYTVVSGDTLSRISARFCGTPSDYLSLAGASGISNPNLIYPGQTIKLKCHAAPLQLTAASTGGTHRSATSHAEHRAAGRHARPGRHAAPGGNVSTAGLGGFEACVISRESGGNPRAVNPSSGAGGLYQFLPSTWASLGFASAYPGGAQTAPVSVQRAAFAKLYAEAGTSPWAPYDGC